MLELFYQNICGARTKLESVKRNFAATENSIVCLTETWFRSDHTDAELCDGEFDTHRKDRDYGRTGTTMGGGSLIVLRKSMISHRMRDFECDLDRLEDVWVRIPLEYGRSLFSCVVYISPFGGNLYLFESFLNKLMSNCDRISLQDGMVMFIGNFNCPELNAHLASVSSNYSLSELLHF